MSSTYICSFFFPLPKNLKTALFYISMTLYDKHTLPMVSQASIMTKLWETTARAATTLFDQRT